MSIGIEFYDLGKYLNAYIEKIEGRKTLIYYIYSKLNETVLLAEIKWYAPWRKYCFFPEDDIVFDNKCLKEILDFINFLNEKHKKGIDKL